MGGTVLIINPRYLFGALEPSAYEVYKEKNRVRQRLCYKTMSEMMISNSLVRVKDAPPYPKELEAPVLLNPLARATYDPKSGSYAFPSKLSTSPALDRSNVKAFTESLSQDATAGVGVDQGMSSNISSCRPDCSLPLRTDFVRAVLEPDVRGP